MAAAAAASHTSSLHLIGPAPLCVCTGAHLWQPHTARTLLLAPSPTASRPYEGRGRAINASASCSLLVLVFWGRASEWGLSFARLLSSSVGMRACERACRCTSSVFSRLATLRALPLAILCVYPLLAHWSLGCVVTSALPSPTEAWRGLAWPENGGGVRRVCRAAEVARRPHIDAHTHIHTSMHTMKRPSNGRAVFGDAKAVACVKNEEGVISGLVAIFSALSGCSFEQCIRSCNW